jgi:hypothetical protein
MTNQELLYTLQFAMESLEHWMCKYPKKVNEDDCKALELLYNAINFVKGKEND